MGIIKELNHLGSSLSQARPRRWRLRAKAVLGRQRWLKLESQRWLKVKCVSISGNYPVSAMLIHTWTLLAASRRRGSEAEVNNDRDNNCKK